MQPTKALLLSLTTALAAVSIAGCHTTHGAVVGNVDSEVLLRDSPYHQFDYVAIDQEGDQLRVYGKLRRQSSDCEGVGDVSLTVLEPSGSQASEYLFPLRNQCTRCRGWHGAAFRGTIPVDLQPGQQLRLAFHQDACGASDRPTLVSPR